MKISWVGSSAIVLFAVVGCDQGTPGGQGVATTPPHKAPAYGETENTFNLSVPRMSTTLRQGGTQDVSIGIERGKNFDDDVTLKFADGPEGVTLAAANPVIKHGDSEAKVTLKAEPDAALGDFTVKVTGHSAKGPDATNELKITVAKK